MPSPHRPIERKPVRTQRLILRPYQLEDYPAWFDAYVHSLPKQSPYDRDPRLAATCTKAVFRTVMSRHERLAKADKIYIYGIFDRKTGALVGVIDFAILIRAHYQLANFGYQIHNTHVRQGFGAEAAAAGLKIGFQHLKLNRLEAAIHVDNKASIKLARAIGMNKEAVRNNYLFENNKWVDHIIYIALPEDVGLKSRKPSIVF